MNKTSNSNDVTIWSALREGWQNIDAHSWPGTVIFLTLIAIEASVNVIASMPDFGLGISIGVGLLFGVFLGMWHIISERPHNSVKQQSVVDFLVQFISALAIVLIISNLLRLDGQVLEEVTILPSAKAMNGWDYFSILLIGISFASHLFGYLIWHKADNRRASIQNYNRKVAIVEDAKKDSELAGRRAEVRLMALEAALSKEEELRTRFSNLPSVQLDRIIKEAVDEVYAAFEKTYNMDLDNSGSVGDKPASNAPTVQYASASPARSMKQNKPQPQMSKREYTLDELLDHFGKSKDEVKELLQSYGLTDPNKAYKALRGYGMLPDDLTHGNFVRLFQENFQ